MTKILYVDMDNVLVDFESALKFCSSELLKRYEGRYDEIPSLFSYMDAMPGAVEAYRILSESYDTYILSTAPWNNHSAWMDKVVWVQNYLGETAYKRLILTHHKNLVIGDYLIDDRTKNGVGEFNGEHIHFGTERFPNWDAVLDYLL